MWGWKITFGWMYDYNFVKIKIGSDASFVPWDFQGTYFFMLYRIPLVQVSQLLSASELLRNGDGVTHVIGSLRITDYTPPSSVVPLIHSFPFAANHGGEEDDPPSDVVRRSIVGQHHITCLHHSPPFISSRRHLITSQPHEKGESRTIRCSARETTSTWVLR